MGSGQRDTRRGVLTRAASGHPHPGPLPEGEGASARSDRRLARSLSGSARSPARVPRIPGHALVRAVHRQPATGPRRENRRPRHRARPLAPAAKPGSGPHDRLQCRFSARGARRLRITGFDRAIPWATRPRQAKSSGSGPFWSKSRSIGSGSPNVFTGLPAACRRLVYRPLMVRCPGLA